MTLMGNAISAEAIEYAPPAAAGKLLADRPLPILCEESAADRWGWLVIAGVVVALYAIMTLGFWAPADGGVDQNAYLLGGRMRDKGDTQDYFPVPRSFCGLVF